MIVALSYGTYTRNKIWKTDESFWFNIIQNAPKKARGYNNYGVSLAKKKQFKKSIPFFRKAIKLDRHYPDPWNNVAVCYNALGKVDIAIEKLQQASRIHPHYPEFHNNLSSFLLAKKDYKNVCIAAQKAIKLRPHYGKAYFNWGQALYRMGKVEEGFKKLKHACRVTDYDTLEGFNSYAQVAVQLKKYDDAIFGFKSVYRINPQDTNALFNLGNIYFLKKDFDQAKKIYLSLINKNPKEYRSWYNLAETYLELNDKKQARLCFEKAKPLGKYMPQIHRRLAQHKVKTEPKRSQA